MSNLPINWESAALVDFCERLVDGSHNPPRATAVGRPMLSARNVTEYQIVFDDYRLISEDDFVIEHARTRVEAGDVLITIVGTIGRTAVVPVGLQSFALQRSVAVLKPRGIDSRYLAYALNTPDRQQWLVDNAKGTAQKGVYLKTLATARVPIAPAAEQIRIVAKLEELLSDLDASVAELKAAQKKLAKYRQSLLKAAVEGALTADWRAQRAQRGEAFETGAQLLERILRERRARWEAKQLARFEEQGKTPPKVWQDKYPEPVPPDTTDLPEIPQGWVWASLDQLLCDLRSGSAETSGRVETDFPVLKSSAVRQAAIDFTALNYFQRQQCRSENYLDAGDLLITRLSGTVDYVGCAAVVNSVLAVGVQYPDRVFCGKTLPSMPWLGELLVCWFRSGYARNRIETAAKSTAGHKRISLSDLHPFPLPLPPMSEAKEVVLRATESLKQVQDGEAAVARAVKHAAVQRKNILKAAFSGQLVPQDPADEPAGQLLERIQAERAARSSQSAAKKARGRQAANLTLCLDVVETIQSASAP